MRLDRGLDAVGAVRGSAIGLALALCGCVRPIPCAISRVRPAAHQNTGVVAVVLSPSAATMTVGESLRIKASVDADAGVINRVVGSWCSTDPSVTSVDDFAVVTAHAPGTATIVTYAAADTTVTGTMVVTVKKREPR